MEEELKELKSGKEVPIKVSSKKYRDLIFESFVEENQLYAPIFAIIKRRFEDFFRTLSYSSINAETLRHIKSKIRDRIYMQAFQYIRVDSELQQLLIEHLWAKQKASTPDLVSELLQDERIRIFESFVENLFGLLKLMQSCLRENAKDGYQWARRASIAEEEVRKRAEEDSQNLIDIDSEGYYIIKAKEYVKLHKNSTRKPSLRGYVKYLGPDVKRTTITENLKRMKIYEKVSSIINLNC